MPFDIGKMEIKKHSEKGVDFQLEHPIDGPITDENGKPLTINLSGADCSRIKATVRERERKIKAAKAEGSFKEPDDDAQETENIKDLIMLTNGWSENWALDGKPFPFSKENAEQLYRRFPHIAAWATGKITNQLNFMRGWSKK